MHAKNQMKLAVVLSGGGLRSAAQIGVLEVLEDYGIRPSCVVGTSGGAIIAALYASGLTPKEIAELYKSIIGHEHKFIDLSFGQFWQALLSLDLAKLKGLVKGERLRTFVHRELRIVKDFTDFGKLPPHLREKVVDLYLTAVDINDGSEVVFCAPRQQAQASYGESFARFRLRGDISIADATRASIGIPGVFEPFVSGGTYYVDGGIRDNLPLLVAIKLGGAQAVLGVDLGYAGLRHTDIIDNGIIDILAQSIGIMGMDQLAADLSDKALSKVPVIILNPMIYDIGLLDTYYIPAMIKRGRLLAETFCKTKGLDRRNSPTDNLRLLYTGVSAPVLFPTKESPVYPLFRKQLTELNPKPEPTAGLVRTIVDFWRKVQQGLVVTVGIAVTALGMLLVWGDPIQVQGLGILLILVGLLGVYLSTSRREGFGNHK